MGIPHGAPAWADLFPTWCLLGPHVFPTWMPLWSPLVSPVGNQLGTRWERGGNRVVIRRGVNQVGARWEWTRWEQGGDERVGGGMCCFSPGPHLVPILFPLGLRVVPTWFSHLFPAWFPRALPHLGTN